MGEYRDINKAPFPYVLNTASCKSSAIIDCYNVKMSM